MHASVWLCGVCFTNWAEVWWLLHGEDATMGSHCFGRVKWRIGFLCLGKALKSVANVSCIIASTDGASNRKKGPGWELCFQPEPGSSIRAGPLGQWWQERMQMLQRVLHVRQSKLDWFQLQHLRASTWCHWTPRGVLVRSVLGMKTLELGWLWFDKQIQKVLVLWRITTQHGVPFPVEFVVKTKICKDNEGWYNCLVKISMGFAMKRFHRRIGLTSLWRSWNVLWWDITGVMSRKAQRSRKGRKFAFLILFWLLAVWVARILAVQWGWWYICEPLSLSLLFAFWSFTLHLHLHSTNLFWFFRQC